MISRIAQPRKMPRKILKQRSSKKARKLVFILSCSLLLLLIGILVFINWEIRGFEVYHAQKEGKRFAKAGLSLPLAADFLASAPSTWGTDIENRGQEARTRPYAMHYYLSETLEAAPQKPILYLVHGSPGGAVNFLGEAYFLNPELRKRFVLLAVDRPGYGRSSPGHAEPQFNRAIQPMLEQLQQLKESYPQRPIYGVGWSFGGSLLALMAERSSQNPELLVHSRRILDGAIIVGAPADPQQEKFWWFNPLLNSPWLQWLFVSGIIVANKEKLAHPAELEKMRHSWGRIRIPVAYLQGTEDAIVLPQNIEFLQQQAQKAVPPSLIYEIEGGNHSILFSEIDLIESILRSWQGT